MQASIEALPALDVERSISLRNYLRRPGAKSFCRQYVLEVTGKDLKRLAIQLKKKDVARKLALKSIQPVYRYELKKTEIQRLAQAVPNPDDLVAVISSRDTNKSFIGLRRSSLTETSNQKDDDLNGYVDDRFGINSDENEQTNSSEEHGYVTLAVAKDSGERIDYSTIEAAQGILYALHRGASKIILPFLENDSVLNELARSFKSTGGNVVTDPSTVSASTSSLVIKGNIQFDYDPNTLGYKDDHFKMLVLSAVSSSSGGTEPAPLGISSAVKSELRKISPAFYEYRITNPPTGRFMMPLAGEYFLCGDGKSFMPILDMGTLSGEVPGPKYTCYWAPGMTATTKININESTDKSPVRGVYVAVDNITPGVSYEDSFKHFYTRLNGDTELTYPVGSFIRYTVYDNWQLMDDANYGGRVAYSEKQYVWTPVTKAVAFGTRDLGIGVCFKAMLNGKGARDTDVKGDFYKGSAGYFSITDSGADGYNCFSNILQQASWSLAAMSPYAGDVNGTLGSSSIHVDLALTSRPTASPTPRMSPSKTPTRAATPTSTKEGGVTMTPKPSSTGTPTVTRTVSSPTPRPTVVATLMMTPMNTSTATRTATPKSVTVETILVSSTGQTSLSGYSVRLFVNGTQKSEQTTDISGSVKFSNVPFGEIRVEAQRTEQCEWQYAYEMPFKDLPPGGIIIQTAWQMCGGKYTPTITPTRSKTPTATATATTPAKLTTTPTPSATSTGLPQKTGTQTPTKTPTRTPTRTVTPTRTSLSSTQPTPYPTAVKTIAPWPTSISTRTIAPTATATATRTVRSTPTSTPSGRMTPHSEWVHGRIMTLSNRPAVGVPVVAYIPRKADLYNPPATMVFQSETDSNGEYRFNELYVSNEGYVITVVPGVTLDYPISTRNPEYAPNEIIIDLSSAPNDNVVADIRHLVAEAQPTATPTPRKTAVPTPASGTVTVNALLFDSAEKPIVGQGVQLSVSGISKETLHTDSTGRVKFERVPLGEIVLRPDSNHGCDEWSASVPMPIKSAQAGAVVTQIFNFSCRAY